MLPYNRIARNDDEADRADQARDEWIAERKGVLFAEYKANATKRDEALTEFVSNADVTDLDLALRLFLASYENANSTASVAEAAVDLSASIWGYIEPILKEYAGDDARAERDAMEARELDIAAERRTAA